VLNCEKHQSNRNDISGCKAVNRIAIRSVSRVVKGHQKGHCATVWQASVNISIHRIREGEIVVWYFYPWYTIDID